MPKKISDRQLAANRANARRSTGPRTAEGKARSSQNARKHVFTAADFHVVRLEDLNEIANMRADLVAAYKPVNSEELFALERIAVARQTLLRAARLESGLFTACLNHALSRDDECFIAMAPDLAGDGDIEITRAQNRNFALAQGFERMATATDTWKLFLRYHVQHERLYRRAVEDYERIRALRAEIAKVPDEPIFDPQPPPAKTTSPPPNEPVSEPEPVHLPHPTAAPEPVARGRATASPACRRRVPFPARSVECRRPASRLQCPQPRRVASSLAGVFAPPPPSSG